MFNLPPWRHKGVDVSFASFLCAKEKEELFQIEN